MADRIETLANMDSDVKAQVEEGLRESFAQQNRDIPSNFTSIVQTITAIVNEYGIKSEHLEYGHQVTFSLFTSGLGASVSSILNYGVSDDPWPKAIAKAIAGVSYDILGGLTGIGLKGVSNVAISYGTGNVLSNLVDKGYDILVGPDYAVETTIGTSGKITNITVDYTLQDALLIPDKLREFLKAENIIGDWALTDRKGQKLEYFNHDNTYVLRNTSLSTATSSNLIDGLLVYDSYGTLPAKISFSDTATLTIQPLYYSESTLASMAKSDGRVMYALNNLNSYYIDSSNAPTDNPANYSQNYINDRALLLYINNWKVKNEQTHYKDILDAVYDPEADIREYLRSEKTYIIDRKNGVEYGIKFLGMRVDDHKTIEFGTDGSDNNFEYTDNDDRLYGMGGNDTLKGGKGNDHLEGGKGFDTYITDNGDTILDSDHQGKVTFEDIELKGAVWNPWTGEYESISNKNETYTLDNDTLTITHEDKTLTIENYSKEDKSLSIDLNSYLTLEIEDARFKEGDDTHNEKIGFKHLLSQTFLHVRTKIQQKGATYGAQQKVA